jgi:hypothetical protein
MPTSASIPHPTSLSLEVAGTHDALERSAFTTDASLNPRETEDQRMSMAVSRSASE